MKRHKWFLVLLMVFLIGTTAEAQRGGGPADPLPLAGPDVLNLINVLGQRGGGGRGAPPAQGNATQINPDLVNEVRLILAPAGGAWWTNTALVTRLGLTEDQKLRIERAYESHRQNLLSSKGTLEKEEAQLAKLLESEPLDRTAGIAQIYKVIQARGEMEKTNGLMTFEMREVLTRAQWVQLQAAQTTGIGLNMPNQVASAGVPGQRGGRGSIPLAANEATAVSNLRTINTAQVMYLEGNYPGARDLPSSRGSYASLSSLIAAGLLSSSFTGAVEGYSFSVTTTGREYTATALPASPQMGRFGFYSIPDAVVRYSTDPNLSPPGQGGNPVR